MKQIVDFVKNDKRILITGIIILFLIIIGTILAFTVGSSTAYTLENELREMGKDFYENFFYDEFNSSESEREEFLAKYRTIGFKVNLSNLVRTNKKVNEEKVKNFVNPKTNEKCDMENTKVTIYPKSPYGKSDYDMEVEIVCGEELN